MWLEKIYSQNLRADITDPRILGLDFLHQLYSRSGERDTTRVESEIPLFSEAKCTSIQSRVCIGEKRTIITARSECLIHEFPVLDRQLDMSTNFPSQVSQRKVFFCGVHTVDSGNKAIPC
ncbi:hypothetical protein AVEN_8441-1 [Araneus ventricosus]|uniref:Uncharacterized protein n=1 Tax=Araneus ventricosus TaxID=182803 RepID=A0A4Y2IDV4_ARAVE|nr:hypothetical protein AVEN_8441-1 [Araneus ventricosus]